MNGQNINKNVKDLKGTPEGGTAAPTKIEALSSDRLYFQTRSVISLRLRGDAVNTGDTVSLLDTTTNTTLLDHQPVADDTTVLALNTPTRLKLLPNDIMISLFPDGKEQGGFAYGENVVHLLIDSQPDGQKVSDKTIYLKDFNFFSPQYAHFDTDHQRRGGFQGEVLPLKTSVVKSNGSVLSTGMVNVLNQ